MPDYIYLGNDSVKLPSKSVKLNAPSITQIDYTLLSLYFINLHFYKMTNILQMVLWAICLPITISVIN